MSIADGFTGSVGNTPLIRLRRVSEETGCEILGKAEFMNPGGSVKDRAARAIVLRGREERRICPRRERSSKAPPAIPESGSPMCAMRAVIVASS